MGKKRKEYIDVIIKHPGRFPRFTKIENELKAFQREVGGYIEPIRLMEDMVILVNEEGRLLGLEPNIQVCGHEIVGPCVLVGVDGEEFCDCPLGFDVAKKYFGSLWEV